MAVSDVVSSFDEFHDDLYDFFREYNQQKVRFSVAAFAPFPLTISPDSQSLKVKRSKEYDHLSLLPTLLSTEQQHKMMDRLFEEFTTTEEHGMLPRSVRAPALPIFFRSNLVHRLFQYDTMFWEVMLPEWGLRCFMKRFSFDRATAIDEIKQQDCVTDMSFSINSIS